MLRSLFIALFIPLTTSAVTLSLDDIAPCVRDHHPALKAARLGIEEARGRQLGAGRLTNPRIETSFQNESRWKSAHRFGTTPISALPIS